MNKCSTAPLGDLTQDIRLKIRHVAYEKARTRLLDQPGYAAEDLARAEREVLAALQDA